MFSHHPLMTPQNRCCKWKTPRIYSFRVCIFTLGSVKFNIRQLNQAPAILDLFRRVTTQTQRRSFYWWLLWYCKGNSREVLAYAGQDFKKINRQDFKKVTSQRRRLRKKREDSPTRALSACMLWLSAKLLSLE